MFITNLDLKQELQVRDRSRNSSATSDTLHNLPNGAVLRFDSSQNKYFRSVSSEKDSQVAAAPAGRGPVNVDLFECF